MTLKILKTIRDLMRENKSGRTSQGNLSINQNVNQVHYSNCRAAFVFEQCKPKPHVPIQIDNDLCLQRKNVDKSRLCFIAITLRSQQLCYFSPILERYACHLWKPSGTPIMSPCQSCMVAVNHQIANVNMSP